jgi:hypothetical protein
VRYIDSFPVSLNPIIVEWAEASNEHKAEILRRLCHFGTFGLIFDQAFRRVDGTPIPLRTVAHVAEALFSTSRIVRADAEAYLAQIKVSVDAIQDFCHVTGTLLPTAALGTKGITDWVLAAHRAPPYRDPTANEIETTEALCQARMLNAPDRSDWRRPAPNGLSNYTAISEARPPHAAPHSQVLPSGSEPAHDDPVATVQAATPTSIVNAPPQAARPKPLPVAELVAWYKGHVDGWTAARPPTCEQEIAALKTAYPNHSVARDRVRKARQEFAPDCWRARGRKKSARNSAG